MDTFRSNQADIAIQSRPRIPTGGLGSVFQTDSQHIVFTVGIQQTGNIAMKRVIPERPETSFFPIDIDPSLTHSTIENQSDLLVGRSIKSRTIPTDTHIRQPSGTPGLYGSLLFKVLRNRYLLQIVVAVERTKDGPIMRNGHCFPLTVVEICLCCFGNISLGELPVLFQQCFCTLRHCRQGKTGAAGKDKYCLSHSSLKDFVNIII